jgi:hypothetical protein
MSTPEPLAIVRCCTGRWCLFVAGIVLAVEGDKCRDGNLPESVLPPIPPEELEHAAIGGEPAKDMPVEMVRWFRGDCWNEAMLEYVAGKINEAVAERSPYA